MADAENVPNFRRGQQLASQRSELADVVARGAGTDGRDWPFATHTRAPWKSVPAKTMTSGLPSCGAGMPWL